MASLNNGKDEVCAWIRERFRPGDRILDVGACDGKWKMLLPEYAMDACEAWEPNARQIKGLYQNVFVRDIAELTYKWYDLIIFGDVIEHMDVATARHVLSYAWMRCRDLIVGVPYLWPQGEYMGNPWEVHIQDDLTPEIFAERYPELKVLLPAGKRYCYYHKRMDDDLR